MQEVIPHVQNIKIFIFKIKFEVLDAYLGVYKKYWTLPCLFLLARVANVWPTPSFLITCFLFYRDLNVSLLLQERRKKNNMMLEICHNGSVFSHSLCSYCGLSCKMH